MEREDEIQQHLREFVSSFDVLNDIHILSKERNKITIAKLLGEFNELEVDIETTRKWNLISFLYFLIGDKKKALHYNKLVTEKDVGNIIATTNKAWFYYKDQKFYECNEICQKLENDQPSSLQLLKAKAEIAYTYSRLGCQVYKIAEERYANVLEECKNISSVPVEYLCIWKLGQALALRRQFNVLHWYSSSDNGITKQKVRDVLLLYLEISHIACESVCKYRARANVEIGQFIDNIEKEELQAVFPIEITSEYKNKFQLESSEYYIKRANEICPDDVFVLERSGKYYRYKGKIDLSITLLRKALTIRETSFGHHHLALSLMRKATFTRRSHSDKPLMYRSNENVSHMDNLNVVTNVYKTKIPINYNYQRENKTVQLEAERIEANCFESRLIGMIDTEDTIPYPTKKNDGTESLKQSFSDLKVENTTRCNNSCNDMSKATVRLRSTLMTSTSNQGTSDKELPHKHVNYQCSKASSETSTFQRSDNIDDAYSNIVATDNDDCEWEKVVNKRNKRKRQYSYKEEDSFNRLTHGKAMYNRTLSEGRYASVRSEKDVLETEYYPFIKAMLKSPRYIQNLYDNSFNKEIFEHLDKALEISKFNQSALYDKGLMLRYTRHPQEALCVFQQLMKEECPIIQLSKTYEQAAFCLMDIRRSTINHAEQDRTDYYVKHYLIKSIETSCNIVSRLPSLTSCWSSDPTLKSLILGKQNTKQPSREHSHLSKRLSNYGEATGLYKQMVEIENNDDETADVLMKFVNNSVKEINFDEAVLTCELIMVLPNGLKKIDSDVYCSVQIKGGLNALMNGENEMARLRLQNALKFGKKIRQLTMCRDESLLGGKITICDDDLDDDFDVFILCDEDVEEKGRKLKSDLEVTGLKATINSDSVTYGHTEISGMVRAMRRSSHFVVVVSEEGETIPPLVEMLYLSMWEIQKEQAQKNIVVVVDDSFLKVNALLAMHPRISLSKDDTLSQKQFLWLNNLLWMLATGKQI